MPITVNLTSDFICPWCLIGEQRLFHAIDALPDRVDVHVQWFPFELNPDMPKQGMDRRVYRSRKFGSWAHSQALDAHTVTASKPDGIAFDYDRITRTPNTFAAHHLAWLAGREGRQRQVVEGILYGYFSQGRDIGDLQILTEIAGEAGLDRSMVRECLDSGIGADEVQNLLASAREQGIQGVPHLNIEGTVVTGAQQPDLLRRIILDVYTRKTAVKVSQLAASEGDFQ